MTATRDDEQFVRLVETLGPYLDHVVIIGGWAHRLSRHHPLAQRVEHPPLTTLDTDVAIGPGVRHEAESLRERLLRHGFREEFLGDDRPPVTRYHLGQDDSGFYVEFLTPLVGSEFTRRGVRDTTTAVAGVTAQKLRYLEVLQVSPWSVPVRPGRRSSMVRIANPVSFIVQKLLVSGRRKPRERAKDLLYIHDTLELFASALPPLNQLWVDLVRPALGSRGPARVRQAAGRLAATVTDTVREAVAMAAGRTLSPEGVREACEFGLRQMLK